MEQLICRLREELPLDNGAQSIFDAVVRRGQVPPDVRTIHRVLVRNGLVEPQPKKRPRGSYLRFEYEQPNECWQIDATEWHLADGRTVQIMDVLDDHSRYSVAAIAVPAATAQAAWAAICHGATQLGLPAKVLSDNGLCFTGGPAGNGTFRTQLAAVGVATANSRPYHPQTCGKIERSHQTLKKWLRTKPPAATLTELQQQLDTYRSFYNHQRPHRALRGATPAERFHAKPPAQPADTPIQLESPTTLSINERVVDKTGRINIHSKSITIGATHRGTTLTVLTYGHRMIILDNATPIRSITTQPGQTNYPLLSPMS
jgi:transposase InsO family protein